VDGEDRDDAQSLEEQEEEEEPGVVDRPEPPIASSSGLHGTSRPKANLFEAVVEEVGTKSYRDYMKEAHRARIERELTEKYGPFKDIILHPVTQTVFDKVEELADINWVEPGRVLPTTSAVLIIVMAWRGGMRGLPLMLLVSLMLGVHPHLIIIGLIIHRVFYRKRPEPPKGMSAMPSWPVDSPSAAGSSPDKEVRLEFHKDHVPEGLDFVVLGSDLGALFTAAALGRCGKRVLVLEPGEAATGSVVRVGTTEFVTGDQCLSGKVESYFNMLKALTPPEQAVDWARVGKAESGFVHSAVSVDGMDPLLWRTGVDAFLEDMVSKGADRTMAGAFLLSAQRVAAGMRWWMCSKLPEADQAAIAKNLRGQNDQYLAAWASPARVESLARHDPLLCFLLFSLWQKENLSPAAINHAALVQSIATIVEGKWYPVGGPLAVAAALLPAIESAGGRLLCKARVKEIVVNAEGTATGVRMANDLVIPAAQGVISGLGAHRTWAEFLSDEVRDKFKMPILKHLPRARRVIHVLFKLEGTAEELDLMPTDYFEVPPAIDDQGKMVPPRRGGLGANDGHWMEVRFPSAKDPSWAARCPGVSTCVVTVEAGPEWLDAQSGGTAHFAKLALGLEESVKKRLVLAFPALDGHIESVQVLRQLEERSLSHVVPTFVASPAVDEEPGKDAPSPTIPEEHKAFAAGIKPSTPILNLCLTGRDLVGVNSVNGSIMGGWLALHQVLGYTCSDVALMGRNVISELQEVDKLQKNS